MRLSVQIAKIAISLRITCTKETMATTTRICGNCGKADASKICSKCNFASYCSKECQAKHWNTHKKTCTPGADTCLKFVDGILKTPPKGMELLPLDIMCKISLAYKMGKFPLMKFTDMKMMNTILHLKNTEKILSLISFGNNVPAIKTTIEEASKDNNLYLCIGDNKTLSVSCHNSLNYDRLRYVLHMIRTMNIYNLFGMLIQRFVKEGKETHIPIASEGGVQKGILLFNDANVEKYTKMCMNDIRQ